MKIVRKHTQNTIIDTVSFVLLSALVITGVIIHYVLPAGSRGNSFWSLTRHEWGDIHFWVAVAFEAIILFHLLLHLPWIKASVFGNKRKRRV
jgi:hypothetical protein